MWKEIVTGLVVFMAYVPADHNAFCQNLVWSDSVSVGSLEQISQNGLPLVRYTVTQDLSYALTCSGLLLFNWQQDLNRNNASVQQQLRYRLMLRSRKSLKFINTCTHTLGIQIFFDSIYRFQPDENSIDTRLELNLTKGFHISVISKLSTRMFNCYDHYTNSSGDPEEVLSTSFLTPLFWNVSLGLGWSWDESLKVDLGVTGAKLTYVYNKEVYSQSGNDRFYGVPVDKDFIIEYGLSLQLLIDKRLMKFLHWNCDLLLFRKHDRQVDLTMKNLFAIRIAKYLRVSIQTRLFYEEEVSRNLQVENLISAGFNISW